ncbi:MAG: substrate-binding domain-containing protein [Dehalococcoidales bacterium]|nr:substrate-binding domain-containing protein [Dehalococcoidales bacterium]
MNFKRFLKSKFSVRAVSIVLAATALVTAALPVLAADDYLDAWDSSSNLRIAGSTTLYPIVAASLGVTTVGQVQAVGPFQASAGGSGCIAQLYSGGSGHGAYAVTQGDANLGMCSSNKKSSYPDIRNDVVARDGVCVIIHDDGSLSAIDALTTTVIGDIYEGIYTKWSDINAAWPATDIFPIARIIGSGTRDTIVSKCAMNEAAEEAYLGPLYATAGYTRKDSNAEVVADVNATAVGSIGYIGVGYLGSISGDVRAIPVKANDAAPAVVPTDQNVTRGTYAISRYLYLVANGVTPNLGAYGAAFRDYLYSDAGQNTVKDQGFVMVNPRQDVDASSTVDINDIVSIGLSWNKSTGQQGYVITKDVNRDGSIDINDVVSVGLWWNITYTTPANEW